LASEKNTIGGHSQNGTYCIVPMRIENRNIDDVSIYSGQFDHSKYIFDGKIK